MKKSKIEELVTTCIKDYFESIEIDQDVHSDLSLFGNDSPIDSIGLANIIIDIEARMSEENHDILLTSEEAMSRSRSPFRTVSTLIEFIYQQIGATE